MLQVATDAAKAAGDVLLEYYDRNIDGQAKGRSIVSEADTAAEKVILDQLHTNFSDHRIFSEEAGDDKVDSDYVWVVDPLDGTTNFVHRFARYCVSIGLLYKGKPQLGVIWEPQLEEMFAAEVGRGATLNDKPIHASERSDMSTAVVQVGRGSTLDAVEHFGRVLPPVNKHVRTLRSIGATALAATYTACGRFDAHIGAGTYLYDGIAGGVIAAEAGAKVTDFRGADWNPPVGGMADFLVSNSSLHSEFVAILSDI